MLKAPLNAGHCQQELIAVAYGRKLIENGKWKMDIPSKQH